MFNFYKLPLQTRIGIVAVGCWIGVILTINKDVLLHGALIRSAISLTAVWIAWPELASLPRWVYYAMVPAFIIAVFRPIMLIYLIPLILLILFIMPKRRKK